MLDDEIIAFCKNSVENIFWIPQEASATSLQQPSSCWQDNKQYGIIKIPLAKNMIGLYSIERALFETTASSDSFRYNDLIYCGFYHEKTEKIYLNRPQSIQVLFPLNFHYEEIPILQMCTALSEEFTKRMSVNFNLQKALSRYDFDEPSCLMMFWPSYQKYGENFKASIPHTIFLSQGCVKENSQISLYLAHPEEWVKKAADLLEDISAFYSNLKLVMESQLLTEAICQIISKKPDHILNKCRNILSTLEGKNSVVLRFEVGGKECDIRYPVDKLDLFGSSLQYGEKKKRKEVISLIGKSGFWIEDISAILYRDRVLYAKST